MKKYSFSNKKNILIIIYFVFLISWLVFIFSNSLSTGTESTQQSQKVVDISQKIVSFFDKDAVVDEQAVRTSAHFIEFFVLGFIYFVGTFFFEKKSVLLVIASVSLSLFTALVDETLQLHVEGRGAQVVDVWVDFLGALFAHIIVVFVIYCVKLYKLKRN